MANSIALASKFVPILDTIYQQAAKTAILEADASIVSQGAAANEIVIPKISMQGLGSYSRNTGYTAGDVTMTKETVTMNIDRSRKFTVDSMDNEETAGIAFGSLSGEFIRTKVVPELDATRFASLAGTSGISTATGADLTTGDAVLAALIVAQNKLDSDEVDTENRVLFITPGHLRLAQNVDNTKSKAVLDGVSDIVTVPQGRFYTAITTKDGSTSGEEAGGFSKASGAKDINFMIVQKSATIIFTKHVAPKIIDPEMNQSGDGYIFGYRIYGLTDTYENKVAGIYLHKATT